MHSYSNQPTKYQVCASGARCLSVIAVPVLQGCCENRTWPKAAIERLANWALGLQWQRSAFFRWPWLWLMLCMCESSTYP